jgi:hypothetical protein
MEEEFKKTVLDHNQDNKHHKLCKHARNNTKLAKMGQLYFTFEVKGTRVPEPLQHLWDTATTATAGTKRKPLAYSMPPQHALGSGCSGEWEEGRSALTITRCFRTTVSQLGVNSKPVRRGNRLQFHRKTADRQRPTGQQSKLKVLSQANRLTGDTAPPPPVRAQRYACTSDCVGTELDSVHGK